MNKYITGVEYTAIKIVRDPKKLLYDEASDKYYEFLFDTSHMSATDELVIYKGDIVRSFTLEELEAIGIYPELKIKK